jgi:hypothetical protein
MSDIQFSNNFSDCSESTGFQFEFYCQVCNDAWRSEFHRYAAGTASQLLGGAGSLLGGIFGGAQSAVDTMRDAGYKTAHDKAFANAIEQAQVHFKRCRRCHNHVCAQCWNPNLNLCVNCAPSVQEEADVAARQKEIELAQTSAQAAVAEGERKTDENVSCDSCGARVRPGKFCSECGAKLATQNNCSACGVALEGSPKFCPECGAKQ